jgi:hypothetical protein
LFSRKPGRIHHARLELTRFLTVEDGCFFDWSCHDKYVFKLNIRVQRYKEFVKKRGICALKVTEGGCFFVTFVFFLMGIVPNNHQNSYNNETIIIDCVGLGGAGADGM